MTFAFRSIFQGLLLLTACSDLSAKISEPKRAGRQATVPHAVSFPLECSFGSKANGLDNASACAVLTEEGLQISPAVLADLSYQRGLATIGIPDKGWFYRRQDGRTMRMLTFEMGPDYFADGLARAVIDGKLAYVDRQLRVRLRTTYDWGEPFAGGRAKVCTGCVETKTDGGEHSVMTGGRWATIDKRGRELPAVATGVVGRN